MSQAKDKAKELVERFTLELSPILSFSPYFRTKSSLLLLEAKQCALICVDEMLQEIEDFPYDQILTK
jgi:hypothetical protein|tara:strand:+ start:934 stop:1134 length:201 start_codon:yes stop_codon:yes gene_type:complete